MSDKEVAVVKKKEVLLFDMKGVLEKEHSNLVFIYVLVFLELPSTCTYVPVPVNKRPVFKVMKHKKHCFCLTTGMLGQACRGMSDIGRGRAQAQLSLVWTSSLHGNWFITNKIMQNLQKN